MWTEETKKWSLQWPGLSYQIKAKTILTSAPWAHNFVCNKDVKNLYQIQTTYIVWLQPTKQKNLQKKSVDANLNKTILYSILKHFFNDTGKTGKAKNRGKWNVTSYKAETFHKSVLEKQNVSHKYEEFTKAWLKHYFVWFNASLNGFQKDQFLLGSFQEICVYHKTLNKNKNKICSNYLW